MSSHNKLLHKLKSYGISGNLLIWISVFLHNRSQTVRIGTSSPISNSCLVTCGIPQGSVLGPTLFIIFVNDISDSFDPVIQTKLFADDIKIYSVINDHSSTACFQSHLDIIHSWSITWQLPIAHHRLLCSRLVLTFTPYPTTYSRSLITY